MKQTILTILFSTLLSLFPSSAQAGFWEVLEGIRGTGNIIREADATIESLRNTLDLDIPEEQAEEIEDVNDLYQVWYVNLAEDEKEWVAHLLTEIASGNNTQISELTESEWYQSKDHQEQQRVNQLYFNLQTILDEVQDRNGFYAYAFCINSGSQTCN